MAGVKHTFSVAIADDASAIAAGMVLLREYADGLVSHDYAPPHSRACFAGTCAIFPYPSVGVGKFVAVNTMRHSSVSSANPALGRRISHIVKSCSGRKMLRIHAFSVVATMHYVKAAWDWAFRKFIGNTMGVGFFPENTNDAVSGSVNGRDPFPTLRWVALLYLVMESFHSNRSYHRMIENGRG